MENKQYICDLLCATLQATRDQADLVKITYELNDEKEVAILEYPAGTREVNVHWDSGVALIRDIMISLHD